MGKGGSGGREREGEAEEDKEEGAEGRRGGEEHGKTKDVDKRTCLKGGKGPTVQKKAQKQLLQPRRP